MTNMTVPGTSNIYLIGFRCTGKTSVGKIVSHILGWPFVDTDALIQEKLNQSITQIVHNKGWDYFRTIEKNTLMELALLTDHIVSTGGGIILDPENRQLLKNGKTVWLDAEEDVILDRMIADTNSAAARPSLTQQNPKDEIRYLMTIRNQFYLDSSEFKIDTSTLSPQQIANLILRRFFHDRQ